MAQTVLTYDIAADSSPLTVNPSRVFDGKFVSFQIEGSAAVNGAVTVKLQQAGTASGTFKDVSGTTATVNTSTSEFFDAGQINGAFMQFDVNEGTATAGVITITLTYK